VEQNDSVLAQLRNAAHDPRLERPSGAFVADFFDYLTEAERVRFLSIGAIGDLRSALRREEQRLGVSRGATGLTAHQGAALEAAWERSELARIEDTNGYPHLNGLTLIGMFGNLDGLVEQLAPWARQTSATTHLRKRLQRVTQDQPDLAAAVEDANPGAMSAILDAGVSVLLEGLPRLDKLWGAGPRRWERRLEGCGLEAPGDRPLPSDLADALCEISALRDVLVHRVGRVDAMAISKCFRLSSHLALVEGQFVRIDRHLYRIYSAALRAFGMEVTHRLFRRAGIHEFEVQLPDWRSYAMVGA
jgi:hypothetical protein